MTMARVNSIPLQRTIRYCKIEGENGQRGRKNECSFGDSDGLDNERSGRNTCCCKVRSDLQVSAGWRLDVKATFKAGKRIKCISRVSNLSADSYELHHTFQATDEDNTIANFLTGSRDSTAFSPASRCKSRTKRRSSSCAHHD